MYGATLSRSFPTRTKVKAGTTVTFTKVGDTPHTATELKQAKGDTGVLEKGQSKAITLSEPGNYYFKLVLIERWAPNINIAVPLPAGIELLVLDGSFIESGEEFTRLSWLRRPAGATLRAVGSAVLWLGQAHAQVLWSEPRPADDEVSRHSTRRNADCSSLNFLSFRCPFWG